MIEFNEWIRMVLLYTHLLFCVVAMGQVFETDLKIALGKASIKSLSKKSVRVGYLLFAMWISGLAVIYMDTGFGLLAMAEDSKLQLKIVCVTLLSINSLLLHWYSLPAVMKQDHSFAAKKKKQTLGPLKSALIIYISALSLSNWMIAAFIGVSEPLANLGFSTLFKLYIIVQILTFIVSMIAFPYMNKRLMLMKSEYDASVNDLEMEFGTPAYSVIQLGGTVSTQPRRTRKK
ncbi:hypothetical protein N9850_14160 [Granulosicoccus sp.]|nr:hypothetical protein [Granulosicoccus sp.]MDB4224904.1 hypothetical protein [Granulosicoccus sp.]